LIFMSDALISTGIGKLHLVDTALAVRKAGVDIGLIVGWAPSDRWIRALDAIGKVFGERKLGRRLAARRPAGLPSECILSCGWSDFVALGLNRVARIKLMNEFLAQKIGFELFGFQSRKYIRHAAVFHVRSGAGQGGAIQRARRRGMKILVDHSIAHPSEMKELLGKLYHDHGLEFPWDPSNPMWNMVLKDCDDADLLLVNSEYVKETFVRQGYGENKIRVAYLGVREDFIGLKTDYRIMGKPKLLFVGSLDLRKGAIEIFDALRELVRQNIEVELHVLGSSAFAENILKSDSIKDSVIFHGFLPQDQLKKYYAESDLFVFPTYAEGSARCVMESMAAGLPVITTPNCGSPITQGTDGILIQTGDGHELAQQIMSLLANDELRKQIGVSAQYTVRTKYTWNHYGCRVKEIYRELEGLK
jgi:glycosyltransferase involved in cell wall biosynthesis